MKNITIFFVIIFFQLSAFTQNTFNLRPSFNHPTVGFLTAITPTDSCYYAVGLVRDSLPPHLASNLFTKIDLEGDVEFAKILSSSEALIQTYVHPIIKEESDFVVIGNSLEINPQGNIPRAFFLKYNSQGDTILFKEYLHPNYPEEDYFSPRGFSKFSDGSYVFCSWIGATDIIIGNTLYQNSDMMVTKIDAVGNIEWETTFGDNNRNMPTSIIVTENNKIIIGGAKSNPNLVLENYLWQTHIIGLDSLGNQEWSYLSPPEVQRDGAKEMVLLEDGSLIVASGIGYEQEHPSVNDMWFEKSVFKLNPDHELEWEKEFKDNYFSSRTQTNNLIKVSDGSGKV